MNAEVAGEVESAQLSLDKKKVDTTWHVLDKCFLPPRSLMADEWDIACRAATSLGAGIKDALRIIASNIPLFRLPMESLEAIMLRSNRSLKIMPPHTLVVVMMQGHNSLMNLFLVGVGGDEPRACLRCAPATCSVENSALEWCHRTHQPVTSIGKKSARGKDVSFRCVSNKICSASSYARID